MGYGDKEIYTRWSMHSLELWKVGPRTDRPAVALPTGRRAVDGARRRPADDEDAGDAEEARRRATNGSTAPSSSAAGRRSISVRSPGRSTSPTAASLLAFHAVQARRRRSRTRKGVEYLQEAVVPPAGKGRLASVATRSGKTIPAGTFVFACGPWLPKVFPDLLGDRIFPTRQEVFYFGPPSGDARFRPPRDARLGGFRRGDLRAPGLQGARFQGRARPPRPAVRSGHGLARHHARDAGRRPQFRRPAFPRAERRAARRRARCASTRTRPTAIS